MHPPAANEIDALFSESECGQEYDDYRGIER